MGGKRKSQGGVGEVPVNRRKRTTALAATPTKAEDSPPNSVMDVPEIDDTFQVKLEPELDPGQDNSQRELFDDAAEVDRTDSNIIDDRETPSIDRNLGKVDGAPSTLKSSEGRTGPTECGSVTGATVGEEKTDTNPTLSSELNGNPLVNEMREKREGATGMEDEDVDEDTTATTIPSQRHMEGTTVMDDAQKLLPRSESATRDLSKILTTDADVQKDVGSVSNLSLTEQQKDGEITRLTKELQAATSQIEFLQQQVASKNGQIQKLSSKFESLENELQNSTAQWQRLKEELAAFKTRSASYFRDEQGNSELHLAAKEGDEQSVKELIQSDSDVNARNNNSETPLLLSASSEGDPNAALRIVNLLIEQGANAFAVDVEGETFLHKFLSNENPPTASQFRDILDFLVSQNLPSLFNIRDTDNGTTPLMLAVRNMDLDMATISLLQTNGVDFDLVDNIGRSHLSYATEGDRNMKLFVELGPNGNGGTKHKSLAQAIEDMDEDSVRALVRQGADVNETNDDFETPLHLATKAISKKFAMNTIKLLISSGANVDAKDKDGQVFVHQLLFRCVASNPTEAHEMMSFLISNDLSRLFNTPDKSLYTPFQKVVYGVEFERATLSLLKNNGVDFNAADYIGASVLYYATKGDRTLRLISDLVELGANPKHLSLLRQSMLHVAAENGRVDLLQFFLDQGLDVNALDMGGATPLHAAILQKRKNIIEAVQFLLRNGANPDIVDDEGKSARDYFNEKRHMYSDAEPMYSV